VAKPREVPNLSRRERQIMDVLYRLGEASAAQVHAALDEAPTLTTVRGLLRVLVQKGHARQSLDGQRYVYSAAIDRAAAGASMLPHVVETFFRGSPSQAMAALLGPNFKGVSRAELDRLSELIERARRKKK